MVLNGHFENVPHDLFDAQDEQRCGKVFMNLSKLYAHLRVHSSERPFACSFPNCLMSFSQKGNLHQHLERVHGQKKVALGKRASFDTTDTSYCHEKHHETTFEIASNSQKRQNTCKNWTNINVCL